MTEKAKAPLNPLEQAKLDRFNERELTRLQGNYRSYANCKYAIKQDKNQSKNIIKNLEQIKRERRDVKANLTVATGIAHHLEYEGHMASLELHVDGQEHIQSQIDTIKTQIGHMNTQIKRLDAERFRATKVALTDLQHNLNLKKAHRNLEILENRLDVSRKQECLCIAQNTKLRAFIEHMLYDRALFNKLWQKMMVQLCYDKKFLMDMVDRAVLAFHQGAELCNKFDTLRDKSMRDKRMHIVEMLDMIRNLDADHNLHTFLGAKQRHRELFDLESREYKRRQMFRDEHTTKTNFYNRVIDKITKFSDVENIQKAIEKFTKMDDEYFAHFNYMNNLNHQIEFLNECLRKIYTNIDAVGEYNTKKKKYQIDKVDKLNEQLATANTISIEVQTNADTTASNLQKYFETITMVFKTLRCDQTPLDIKLGDQSSATIFNVQQYLSIIEARLNTIINYVFYKERLEADPKVNVMDLVVRGVERPKSDPTALEDIVLVQQCAECAEGEVNRYDEEIVYPMEMDAIRVKVRAKTEAPEIQYRLHNLSKCRLPRSRALVNKRYQ